MRPLLSAEQLQQFHHDVTIHCSVAEDEKFYMVHFNKDDLKQLEELCLFLQLESNRPEQAWVVARSVGMIQWMIGSFNRITVMRDKISHKIVGCITLSGRLLLFQTGENKETMQINVSEINLLCVSKQHRGSRLVPKLINEITCYSLDSSISSKKKMKKNEGRKVKKGDSLWNLTFMKH